MTLLIIDYRLDLLTTAQAGKDIVALLLQSDSTAESITESITESDLSGGKIRSNSIQMSQLDTKKVNHKLKTKDTSKNNYKRDNFQDDQTTITTKIKTIIHTH